MYNAVWYWYDEAGQRRGVQSRKFSMQQYDEALDFVIRKSKELEDRKEDYRLFLELQGKEGLGYINPAGCKFSFTGHSWVEKE